MSLKEQLARASALGFGTAPLGNMVRSIPEEEAAATVHAACGITFISSLNRFIRTSSHRNGPTLPLPPRP